MNQQARRGARDVCARLLPFRGVWRWVSEAQSRVPGGPLRRRRHGDGGPSRAGPGASYTPQGLPTEITQVRFNAGQAVVPYFEGWIKNPDGTFDMVFGYFNRNYSRSLRSRPVRTTRSSR